MHVSEVVLFLGSRSYGVFGTEKGKRKYLELGVCLGWLTNFVLAFV